MLLKEDPYKMLNIKKDASKKEMRKAYRRLAMKWHPDKNPDNPDAEERFREIQQAYEYLINEKTPADQNIKNQWDNEIYSAMQDHPFYNFMEMAVKYYAEKGLEQSEHGKSSEKGFYACQGIWEKAGAEI